MHSADTLLAWVLSAAPVSSTDSARELDCTVDTVQIAASDEPVPLDEPIRVEVHYAGDSTHVLAFDEHDQVTAEIGVWIVDGGHIRIDAAFPDDIRASVTTDANGRVLNIDNEDHAQVAPRIAAVADLLADTEQAGWAPCAFHSVMAVVEVAHVNPLALASTVLAACECLPLLVDEFKDLECPLF